MSTGITVTSRVRKPSRTGLPAHRTGASIFSTTTIATLTTRRSPCGNGGANTLRRTIGVAPPTPSGAEADTAGGRGGAGRGMAAREWYRPLPPPRDLVWSMRNNTNYMETGVLSALELTANFPQTVLE